MPEVKREVRPVEVSYICDACGRGMMESCSEMNLQTGDIEHRCLICDHRATFQWRAYPRINYIGLDENL